MIFSMDTAALAAIGDGLVQVSQAAAPEWLLAFKGARRVTRRTLRRLVGLNATMDTEDRRVLEGSLFPYYGTRADIAEVLFVGTRWYTRHYPSLLPDKRFVTLDVDSAAACHGSPYRHITASVADVHQHLPAGSVDLIIFNGVFGWGLDTLPEVQRTLQGFLQVLRPGGELVIGWNDVPRRSPIELHAVPALAHFEPCIFEPSGVHSLQLDTDNRHRFDFFRKPL